MSMTKKEKEEFNAAIRKAKLLAALRWTGNVEPDVKPPSSSDMKNGAHTTGYTFNSFSKRISHCWSESVFHGDMPYRKHASQGPRWLYSTEALAYAAMRHEIELKAAAELLEIDERIAATKKD